MISVAIAGLGLIGRERLLAIKALSEQGAAVCVAAVMDPDTSRAEQAAADFSSPVAGDLDALIAARPDWYIVAAPHDRAVEIVPRLLATGARVLVEKPLGRSAAEAETLVAAASPGQLWVGFNYRFFAGISALIGDVRRGVFGRPIALEAFIGHGGAPGMNEGWKLDPVRAGGGALVDPGVHLLDLALLLASEPLTVRGGTAWSGFWKTGVEEDCHLLLSGERLATVNLQTSIVRWRSTFRLAFHGEDGYGVVEGRGRSYGAQTYRRGHRWGWRTAASQAASEERVVESSGEDVFARELQALLFPSSRTDEMTVPCDAGQALAGMRLLDACRSHLGLPSGPAGPTAGFVAGRRHTVT